MFNEYSGNPKVEIIEELSPFVVINKSALAKMKLFIDGCENEIGWLGTAYREGKNIYVEDVYLFEQEVHSSTTEITPEGLGKFGEEILKEDNGMEIWNNLKVWGHSHVDMCVSPSVQDCSQMLVFKDSGHNWFLRIIGNKKGVLRFDLYDYEIGVEYNDIPYYEHISKVEKDIMDRIEELTLSLQLVKESIINELKESVDKEIKEKVSEINIGYKYGWSKYGGYTNNIIDLCTDKEEPTTTLIPEYEANSLNYVIDLLEEENECLGIHDLWFAEILVDCDNIKEARENIDLFGFEDIYNDKEIEEMLAWADETVADSQDKEESWWIN